MWVGSASSARSYGWRHTTRATASVQTHAPSAIPSFHVSQICLFSEVSPNHPHASELFDLSCGQVVLLG